MDTVSDGVDSITKAIDVLIAEDNTNHHPFLDEIPFMQASSNQAFTFQLSATDLEDDELGYEIYTNLVGAEVEVSESGVVTFTPPTGFVGEAELLARVFHANTVPSNFSPFDEQFFTLDVVPEPNAGAMLIVAGLCVSALRRPRQT